MSVVKEPSSQNLNAPSKWLQQLDDLCDRFESAWLAGERPRVEDFLADVSDKHKSEATRELLKLEAHYRLKANEMPTVDELRQRFPSLGSVWLRGVVEPVKSRGSSNPAGDTFARAATTDPITGLPTVPGYEVLELIGRGGMGVVYKARDVKLHRLVALKMVSAGDLASPEMLERFRAEARAVASLQHPNLVQIHEVGEHLGRPYLAFEFVSGGGLDQRLRGMPQPPRAAAQLIKTVAHAIQFAHSRAIIHRDLKPANILLSGDGGEERGEGERTLLPTGANAVARMPTSEQSPSTTLPRPDAGVRATGEAPDRTLQLPSSLTPPPSSLPTPKVSDFGLAKHLENEEQQTRTGAILGTPSYMAPEQATGRSDAIGPATDVYALGAILYEMLTGRPPFRAPTVIETLDQVRSLEPVSLRGIQPNVPRDLETICLKCLQKEPSRRYESAGALADDLDRFLRDEPVLARPVSTTERTWRWCRRHPAVAVLAMLLFVVTLGGFGGILQLWRAAESARERAEDNALAARSQRDQANVQRTRAEVQQQRAESNALVAEDNRLAAETARADAERNQELAEINFAQAEARFKQVQTSAREIAELGATLMKQPHMEATGRQVLEKAVRLQELILADKSDDPVVQLETARLSKGVGWTQHVIGLHASAEANTQKAIALLEPLVSQKPDDIPLRRNLRETHSQMGFIRLAMQDYEGAEQSLRISLDMAESLRARRQATAYDVTSLAHVLTNLSGLVSAKGDSETATAMLQRAVEQLRPVVKKYPLKNVDSTREWYHGELALALGNLAEFTWRTDREAGERYAREALNIRLKMQGLHPNSRGQTEYTARSHQQIAGMMLASGNEREAEAHLTNAFNLIKNVVTMYPDHWPSRHRLFEIIDRLKPLVLKRGDTALADSLTLTEFSAAKPPAERANYTAGDQFKFASIQIDTAKVRVKHGNPQAAATLLLTAITELKALHEQSADKLKYLPKLLEAMNDYCRLGRKTVFEGKILQMLEDRLSLLPNDAGANNSVAWWLSVARDKRLLNPDRAVELARKAVSLQPEMAAFHTTLGTAQYRAGKLNDARAELEKSLELKFKEPALNWYLLAAIAHRNGQPDDAKKLFDQAAADHQANHPGDDDHEHLATEVRTLLGQ
ncbi:MAG: protein kinase family protein [Planctomycetota bacterium]|nr:MAG: protein kinase family protein [Planctomycetota bacterium]